MENFDFLKKKYNLHNTPETESAKKRTEFNTDEKVPNNPKDLIENYLNRFREIADRKDPEDKEMGMQALKKVLLDKFVTKFEDIPQSYWDLNDRIIRERGQSGDWNNYTEKQKNQERKNQVEGMLTDQKASLEQWIDYLASDDSKFPDYIKYWIFRSVTELQEFDKEKRKYPKRSKGTVAMFPDINQEALSYAIDAVIKKHNNTEFQFEKFEADITIERKEEFKKYINNENFADIYSWANELIHPIPEHLLHVTEGEWRKYEQDRDNTENYKKLVDSIRGRGTGWCTAGENTAKSQLNGGDFHCYYTLDDDRKPTIPRIAIRMQEGKIAEVRGIAYKQNLDPYMGNVLEEKLNDFPDKEQYLKKDKDMKYLTEIDNKTKKGEKLSREELVFLYEKDSRIIGFGYEKDPRINELIEARISHQEDMQIIFDCNEEQIACKTKDLGEKTKIYAGDISLDVFNFPNLEQVYKNFPLTKSLEQEKLNSMKYLAQINNKICGNLELNRDELVFLYKNGVDISIFEESQRPIFESMWLKRDFNKDAPIIFECTKEQIAYKVNDLNEQSKIYIGDISLEVFNSPNLEQVYESYPIINPLEQEKLNKMKYLAQINSKINNNLELNKDELTFLYQTGGKLIIFDKKQKSVTETMWLKRDFKKDAPIMFECTKEQIAYGENEINKNTKAYIGEWNPEVFRKLPQDVEFIYRSFPEDRILKKLIEFTTKTQEEYIEELKKINVRFNSSGYLRGHNKMISFEKEMLKEIKPLDNPEKLQVISFSVADLGFKEEPKLQEIYNRAKKFNLELCPLQAVPELCLDSNFSSSNLDESGFMIAMNPILLDGDREGRTLGVRSNYNGTTMISSPSRSLEDVWRLKAKFIFSLNKNS